jgi:hypothetical protein
MRRLAGSTGFAAALSLVAAPAASATPPHAPGRSVTNGCVVDVEQVDGTYFRRGRLL